MANPVRVHPKLNVKNVDRDGHPLRVGDRVGFIMRGWFLPREQESFGSITEIDERGAIKIEAIENYRRFTTNGFPGNREKVVFYTHHVYDPIKRERRYAKQEGKYLLSVFRINLDDVEHPEQPVTNPTEATPHAAARAVIRKGR